MKTHIPSDGGLSLLLQVDEVVLQRRVVLGVRRRRARRQPQTTTASLPDLA